jgi:hypothetical protein
LWWSALLSHRHAQIRGTTSAGNGTSAASTGESPGQLASSATVNQHDGLHFEDFYLRYQPDIFGYLWTFQSAGGNGLSSAVRVAGLGNPNNADTLYTAAYPT